MVLLIILIIIAVIAFIVYKDKQSVRRKISEFEGKASQPMHFDLLDDNGNPIRKPVIKVEVGGGSDAPIQDLHYFCIKDKGYHVSVWPKDHDQFDIVEFNIAGMSHRDNIDDYLGEFQGTLEAEPTNVYDPNAIKVLAADGNHVGYVPKNITAEVRANTTLPCPCFCYIGCNNNTYFSDCYILRKNP